MRELALFAGAGGGLLASRLLGWRTVCAVEHDAYCVNVLMQRQQDRALEPFPIWDDVRTFDGSAWRGCVDVVSAGFPCQPFSSAARGRTVAEDLWPEARRIVLETRPRFVFAENVQRTPIAIAARELAKFGYMVRCARVSAASVGAPHRRARFWLVADADGNREFTSGGDAEMAESSRADRPDWWSRCRSELLGVDDGIPDRMVRLAALGNAQVPSVAALAWRTLTCID